VGRDKDLACEQLAVAVQPPSTVSYGQLSWSPIGIHCAATRASKKIVASLAPQIDQAAIVRITTKATPCWKRAVVTPRKTLSSIILDFRRRFGGVHFVNFSMQRAPADAELFGSGSDVAVRRCKRLAINFFSVSCRSSGLVFLPESLS